MNVCVTWARGARLASLLVPAIIGAQEAMPISRADAVQSALARGARLGVGRADTALALARLIAARARPNPSLSSAYTKAPPNYHVTVDLPIDLPGIRRSRIGAAEAARLAAAYRYTFERAAVALDADTSYTHAVAALEHVQLSQRNARDADSLLKMAVSRRDAGDASELDVELATVNAGQAENIAAGDSLTYLSSVLDLQAVMGLGASTVLVFPRDSLTLPPSSPTAGDSAFTGRPLNVEAAHAALASATLNARLQRRSLYAFPTLTAGFETGDPTGSEPGILPTIGIAIPLPLLDRNRGPIAQAVAEESRARAELTLAEVESVTEIARARRELTSSQARVERSLRLVSSANRVAAMSLTAYREGAAALPNVLEAQRNARDVLGQYVDAIAAAWIAAAKLRVLTLPAGLEP